MRYVLWGDGDSPHLLKWARALCTEGPAIWPGFELWAASSRGFHDGFDGLVPEVRRLALHTTPRFEGGNFTALRCLPRFARWLRGVRADWVHAHHVSSHGTLAWLASCGLTCVVPFIPSLSRRLASVWLGSLPSMTAAAIACLWSGPCSIASLRSTLGPTLRGGS